MANTPGVQVVAALPKDLTKSLDALTVSLKAVEKQMLANAQSASALERAFGSNKSFATFIKNLKDLKEVNLSNFKTVVSSIQQLTVVTKDLAANDLTKLATGLTATVAAVNAFSKIDATGIDTVGINLANALNVLKGATLGKGTQTSVLALRSFINAYIKLGGASIDTVKINNTLFGPEGIFSNIRKLFETMRSLPLGNDALTKRASASINSISEVIRAYISITNLLNDAATNKVKLPKNDDLFGFVIPFISDAINKFALIDTSKIKNAESLKTVVSAIRNILDVVNSLGSLKLPDLSKEGLFKNFEFGQLDAVYELIYQLITKLSTLGSAVDKANPQGLDAVERIANIIPSIIGALKALKDLPELAATFQTSSKTFGILSKLGGVFNRDSLNSIGALAPVFDVLTKLVAKLSKIGGGAAKANPAGFDALAKIADFLPKILNSIPKLQKAIELIPNFRGEVLLNRLRRFAKLDQVFALIKYVATQMAKIAGRIQRVNPEGFAALSPMAEALGRITSAIPKLLDASERLDTGVVGLLKRRFITIPRFLGVFGDAAQQLSKIASKVKNIQGVSALVNIIKDVIDITSAISSGAKGNGSVAIPKIEGLPAFFKDVAKAANELNGIKASDQRLNAVAGIVSAGKGTETLAENVKKSSGVITRYLGIIGDAFATEFGKYLFDTLKKSISAVINFKQILATNLRAAGDQLKQFGQNLQQTGQNIVSNFGIGKLIHSSGAQLAVEFDDIQKQIEVFASDIGGTTKEIADFANVIGVKYPLSANEALKATLDLAKAGQKFGAIQKILPSAADLAALSDNKDLNQATQFLIQAAGGFRNFTEDVVGGFDNIATASDIVFNVANNTTASIEGLYDGLKESTAAANGFGLSLDETAVTLGTFEDAGKRGTEAGRLLRTVLTGLSNEKGRNELTRLGVAFQNQNGEIRSLGDIVDDLRKKYKELGFSEVDLLKSTSEFGDENARTGLKILLNSKSTNQSLQDLSSAIDAGSTASAGMEKILTSLKGKFSQLQGSIETLNVKAFLPMINRFFAPFVELATNAINLFLTLDDTVIETTSTMLALGAAFATVVGVGLILVGAITSLAGGFVSLAGTVLLVTTNLPLVATILSGIAASIAIALPLILALAGAFAYVSSIITEFFRQIEDKGSTIGKSFSVLKETIGTVVEQLRRLFEIAKIAYDVTIGKLFGAQSEKRLNTINSIIERLTSRFARFRDYLAGITRTDVLTFFIKLENAARPLIDAISKIGSGFFDILTGNFEVGVNKIKFGISSVLESFTELIQKLTGGNFERAIARFSSGKIIAGIRDFAREFAQLVKNAIFSNKDKFEEIGRFILDFFNPFKKASTLLNLVGADDVASFVGGFGDKINDAIIGVFDTIARVAGGQSLGDAVFANFGQLGKDVIGILQSFGNVLNTTLGILRTFLGLFIPVFGSDDISANLEQFGEILDKVLQKLAKGIQLFNDQILVPLKENLPFILNGVTTFIGAILTDLSPAVDIIKDAVTGFGNFIGNVRDLLTGGIDPSEFISKIAADLLNGLQQIPARIGATIANIGRTISSEFVTSIGEAIGRGDFLGAGTIIIQNLASLFLDVAKQIPKFLINVGKTLKSGFLVSLGEALETGDIIKFAKILGGKLVELLESAVGYAFNALVNIFDDFLDRFDNRLVGALVLILGGIGITLIGFLVYNLPAIVATASAALIGIGNSIASLITFGFVSGLSGGFLLAAAAVTAVLGTLFYTVFNDPDGQAQAKEFGQKQVEAITGGVEEATPGLDRAIQEGFAGAFERIGNVQAVGELIENVGEQLKEAVSGAVENVFGEGLISNALGKIVQLPIETIGNLVQGVAAVLNFTVQRILQLYDIAKAILTVAYNAIKPLLDGINNIATALGPVLTTLAGFVSQVLKIAGVIAGVIGAVILAVRVIPSVFGQATQATTYLMKEEQALAQAAKDTANALTEQELKTQLLTKSLLEADYATTELTAAEQAQYQATVNARNGFSGLTSKIGSFVKGIAGYALQAGAIVVLTQALSSFGKALEATFKQNLMQGILTFFQDFTTGLLNLVGLKDVANQINTTFEQIKFLADFYGKEISKILNGVFAQLLNSLNDIRARVQKLAADATGSFDAVAEEYFRLNTLLNDAGKTSADTFFAGFSKALQEGADPAGAALQLKAYGTTVSQKFAEVTTSGLAAAFADNASTFSNALVTLVAAGKSDEVVGAVTDVSDFLAIAALGAGEDAIKNASEENKSKLIEAINSTLDDVDPKSFEFLKIGGEFGELITKGIIEQTPEATALMAKLNIQIVDGKVVTREMATEIVNANYSLETFMETARDQAIDEFNKKVTEGAGEVDKYAEALTGLNSAMEETLSAEKRRRFSELNDQLKRGPEEGGISIKEYKVEAQDLIDEIYTQGTADIADARQRLTDSLSQGLIDNDVFEDQSKALDDYLGKLNRQKAIDQKIIDLQVQLNGKSITPTQFASQLQEYIKKYDDAQNELNNPPLTGGGDGSGNIPLTPPFNVPPEGESDVIQQAKAEDEEVVKIREATAEKVANINDKIQDSQRDYEQQRLEDEAEFQKDSARAAEDHAEKLLEIQKTNGEQLEDAVATRDSSAAQAAIRNRDKAKKNEEDEFTKAQLRRQQDFALQQAENLQKFNQRQSDFQKELTEVQNEGAQKLAEARKTAEGIIATEKSSALIRQQQLQQFGANAGQIIRNFAEGAVGIMSRINPGLTAAVGNTVTGVVNLANRLLSGIRNINPVSTAVSTIGSSLSGLGNIAGNVVSNIGNVVSQAAGNGSSSANNPIANIFSNLFGGNRAGGGNTQRGRVYEVNEKGLPEIFNTPGGRQYMIATKDGKITPPTVGKSLPGGGNMYLTVDLSNMSFAGVDGNPEAIARMVEKRVINGVEELFKKARR